MRPLVCLLLCARAFADTAPPVPPAAQAAPARELPLHELIGPFPSLAAYCAQERSGNEVLSGCRVLRRIGGTALVERRGGAGQRLVDLAVRHRGGWWVDQGDGAGVLYDSNRSRGGFVVVELSDGPGVRLRAVESTFTKGRDGIHWAYYCFGVAVVCRANACSRPLQLAGRRCDLASNDDARPAIWSDWSRWDWRYDLTVGDRTLEVRRGAPFDRFPRERDWFWDAAEEARALPGRWRW